MNEGQLINECRCGYHWINKWQWISMNDWMNGWMNVFQWMNKCQWMNQWQTDK